MYIKKFVIGQVITLSKSKITQKTNLMITTPNIKYEQARSKTSNAGLQSMMIMTIIKV